MLIQVLPILLPLLLPPTSHVLPDRRVFRPRRKLHKLFRLRRPRRPRLPHARAREARQDPPTHGKVLQQHPQRVVRVFKEKSISIKINSVERKYGYDK